MKAFGVQVFECGSCLHPDGGMTEKYRCLVRQRDQLKTRVDELIAAEVSTEMTCPHCGSSCIIAEASIGCVWNGRTWVPGYRCEIEQGDSGHCHNCDKDSPVRKFIEKPAKGHQK